MAVLPLSSVGKNHVPVRSPAYQQPLIRAHAQPVQDIAFSPHNIHQLLTCASDNAVKLWTVPHDGFLVDECSATASFSPSFSGGLKGLAPHASAASVLAVRGVKDVAVFDLEKSLEKLTLTSSLLGGTDLQSLSWSFQGDKLITTTKDKKLRLLDPRSGTVECCVECHAGVRNMKATWLGDTPYFLSCGIGGTQQRELSLWDSRVVGSSSSPIKRERIDTGRGLLFPIFDPDNSLLLLVGKGDVSLRLYEFDRSQCDLFFVSSANVGDAIKGATLMPKQANDLMACEVLRVLKLTENAVQPVSFTVPRKEKLQFHSDLFPPTVNGASPSMSVEEWFGGAVTAPNVVSINPSSSTRKDGGESCQSLIDSDEITATAGLESGTDQASPIPKLLSRASISFGSALGSNKFKHLFGTESPKNSSYFNLRPNIGTSESPLLACSDQFWAIPWQGTGGPIYVSKHGAYGKVEPSAAIIDGHRGTIQDLAFSPFHPNILVSASDDCKVKVWKIPEEGVKDRNFVAGDEAASLDSHTHSVRTCNFHPTLSGFLATTSYDMTIRLWDVEHGAPGAISEINNIVTGLPDMGCAVSNLSFNYDGSLFAVSLRNRVVRICDVRSRFGTVDELGSRDVFSSITDSKALGRNLRVTWCGSPSLNVILTTSAAMSTGMRQVQLWDPRKLSEPVAVRAVDNASGALYSTFDPDTSVCFIAGRGDTSIRYYDISASDEAPSSVTLLSQFQGGSAPISGVCMLPKKVCDVRKIETNRILKLAGDTVTSVSFVLPRADDLKQYFQDDVFPETQRGPTMSFSTWLSDTSQATTPILETVKPDDMQILSTKRDSLPRNFGKSKISSFQEDIRRGEEECKKKDEMFDRLQQLALQRAAYHPNPSGGAKPPIEAKSGDDDSSDGGWDD